LKQHESEIEKEKAEVEKLKGSLMNKKLKELEDRKRLEIRKAYEEAQKIIDDTKRKDEYHFEWA